MSVGVDTMVMIWGLKRVKPRDTSQDVAAMCERAAILFQNLKQTRIIVPAIVVAELLCGVPQEDHGNFIIDIQKNFFCPPFDVSACALSARLWQFHKKQPDGEKNGNRPHLKADIMIIATAKVAGAREFYSHEPRCRKLAEEAGMTPRDLPTHREDFRDDPNLNDPREA
jgi:predicted nucleic acid-binding protein